MQLRTDKNSVLFFLFLFNEGGGEILDNINLYYKKENPFNQKTKFGDKLHGIPGANEILRNKFLEYIQKMARNKVYFSNTTYALIYKLIKTDKIGLYFNPSVKIANFFVSDEPVRVTGGYDFNKRRIEIYVSWKIGYDAIFQVLKSFMPILCNKIFATILSEGLLIYDYKNKGELSKHDKIKEWYFQYFRGFLGDVLKQQNVATKLASLVSQDYGTRMYERIENNLIEGTDPAIKVVKKGQNPELDIEGIPLIKKNPKELHDIFSDAIEDYVNDNLDELGIVNNSGPQYQQMQNMLNEFGNFGEFLYKNKDLELNPKNIQEVPDDEMPTDKRFVKDAESLMKYKMEKEAKEKEDQQFQKYLEKNPQLKAIVDRTKNPKLDQITEKYYKELSGAKNLGMIEKKNKDGTTLMIPQRNSQLALPVQSYVNSSDNQDYISLFLLGKECSLKDVEDAIEGTERSLKCYNDSVARLSAAITSNNTSNEELRKLTERAQLYKKQIDTIYPHLIQLMKQITKGTYNEDTFYKPVLSGDSESKTKNIIETDLANAQKYIETAKKLVKSQGSTDRRNYWWNVPSKEVKTTFNVPYTVERQNNLNLLQNNINRLNALNSIISSDSMSDAQKAAVISQFKTLSDTTKSVVGRMGDNLLQPAISATLWHTRSGATTHLTYSDALNFSNRNDYDRREKLRKQLKDEKAHHGDITAPQYIRDHKITSLDNRLFGNTSIRNASEKIKNNDNDFYSKPNIERNIRVVIDQIKDLGDKINDDLRNNKLNNVNISNRSLADTASMLIDARNLKVNTGRGKISIFDASFNYGSLSSNEKKKLQDNLHNIVSVAGLAKNYIESRARQSYGALDPNINRSTNIDTLQHFFDPSASDKRMKRIIRDLQDVNSRLKNKNSHAASALAKLLNANDQNSEIIDIVNGEFVNDYSDKESRDKLLIFLNKFMTVYNRDSKPGQAYLVLGNKSLLDKANDPKKNYYRLLFLNGLDYLRECIPPWQTIMDHFKNGYATAKHVADVVKSIYRFVKVTLPLKSNMYPYMNQKFGFESMADKDYFDLAYKLTFNIKKMYELKKYSTRSNMIYSEIFLPVSIFQKVLFVNITTQNDYDNTMLYLINCANKGLEEFL